MKVRSLVLLGLLLLGCNAEAQYYDAVASNIVGFVYIDGSGVDVGDTGLIVSTPYVCWPESAFYSGSISSNYLDATSSSNSYRRLVYAVSKTVEDYLITMDSTNRPTYLRVRESVSGASGGNISFSYQITVEHDRNGDMISEP
tara:strand:- start:4818 stop:5246 length:429 start_codon:yes stop_codon:yes gene_type:complete